MQYKISEYNAVKNKVDRTTPYLKSARDNKIAAKKPEIISVAAANPIKEELILFSIKIAGKTTTLIPAAIAVINKLKTM